MPVCNNSVDGDFSYCMREGTEDYQSSIESQHVTIQFLNKPWVITHLEPPMFSFGVHDDDIHRAEGGEICLGFEQAYGILDVGESLSYLNYRVVLDDVSAASSPDGLHSAILSIYDSDTGVVITQTEILPGETQQINGLSDDCPSIKIHVFNTAPGFELSTKWAEVSILSNEVCLEDGSNVELTDTSRGDWSPDVYLFWKNAQDIDGEWGDKWDSLREIVLYDDELTPSELDEGESLDFSWANLNYDGIQSHSYSAINFNILSSGIIDCNNRTHPHILKITGSEPLGIIPYMNCSPNHPVVYSDDNFTLTNTIFLDLDVPDHYEHMRKGLYIYDPTISCYKEMNFTGIIYNPHFPDNLSTHLCLGNELERVPPDSSHPYLAHPPESKIYIWRRQNDNGDAEITLDEDAGRAGASRRNINMLKFYAINSSDGYIFQHDPTDDDYEISYYYGISPLPGYPSDCEYPDERPWYLESISSCCAEMNMDGHGITERGTVIDRFTDNDVRIWVSSNITPVVLSVEPEEYNPLQPENPSIECPDGWQSVTICDPLLIPTSSGHFILSYLGGTVGGEGTFMINETISDTSTEWSG